MGSKKGLSKKLAELSVGIALDQIPARVVANAALPHALGYEV